MGEVKKITNTWVQFKHLSDTSYFKEESPNMFVLRGYLDGATMGKDCIEVDGKVYKSGEVYEVGKVRMNLDSVDYINREFTEESYIFHSIPGYKAELPPFGVIKVFAPKHTWGVNYEPDFDSPFFDANGNKVNFYGYSTNYTANQLMFLAERLGCNAYAAKGSKAENGSEILFHYCVYSYGYGNAVYVKMRFDDILNMDCDLFSRDTMERFRSYCHDMCIIDDCLNFDVFERPLTDAEKLQSSLLFVDWYNRFHQHQFPHGEYPRINQFDKRKKERYNIFKLPKSWKQQTLKEFTELP